MWLQSSEAATFLHSWIIWSSPCFLLGLFSFLLPSSVSQPTNLCKFYYLVLISPAPLPPRIWLLLLDVLLLRVFLAGCFQFLIGSYLGAKKWRWRRWRRRDTEPLLRQLSLSVLQKGTSVLRGLCLWISYAKFSVSVVTNANNEI